MKLKTQLSGALLALTVVAALFVVNGCGPEKPSKAAKDGNGSPETSDPKNAEACSALNNDKDACNKTTFDDGDKCEYDDKKKVCELIPGTPSPEYCLNMSTKEADCRKDKKCTWNDSTEPKCITAAKSILGKCAAVQAQGPCDGDTKSSCAWNSATEKCFEFKAVDQAFKEISAVNRTPGNYADARISKIVKANNDSFVYVVNNAGRSIKIFRNDSPANIATDGNWTPETAGGAAAGVPPGGIAVPAGGAVTAVDFNLPAANVFHAVPSQSGAVFTIADATVANYQGIAVFIGNQKIRTYDSTQNTSLPADAGYAAAPGPGTLGIAAITVDNANAENVVAFNTGDRGGFVPLAVNTVMLGGLGAGGQAASAGPPFAFTTSGAINYIAKPGPLIDSIARAEIANNGDFVQGAAAYAEGANWRHDAATANDRIINALLFHNNALYVGLDNDGTVNKGGVIIINTATNAAIAPHNDTNGERIKSFARRANGDVYAFAGNKIFVFRGLATQPVEIIRESYVQAAANKGNDAAGQSKAGFLGSLANYRKMFSGAWLDADNLLVGDEDNGLFTINFAATKSVKMPK